MATWSIVYVHISLHIFKMYVLVAFQDFIEYFSCILLYFVLYVCLFVCLFICIVPIVFILFLPIVIYSFTTAVKWYIEPYLRLLSFFSAPGPSLYWLVQLWRDRGWAQVHSGKMYREQHQLEKRRGRLFGESKDHQTLWCCCCSDGIWRGRTGKRCGWE